MVILLVGAALAAPVECDPAAAAKMLQEARIEASDVPRHHAWLVPGLALASPGVEGALSQALTAL